MFPETRRLHISKDGLDTAAETMTLETGQSAPDFHVQLADGRMVGLADLRGRPLILIFLRHLA